MDATSDPPFALRLVRKVLPTAAEVHAFTLCTAAEVGLLVRALQRYEPGIVDIIRDLVHRTLPPRILFDPEWRALFKDIMQHVHQARVHFGTADAFIRHQLVTVARPHFHGAVGKFATRRITRSTRQTLQKKSAVAKRAYESRCRTYLGMLALAAAFMFAPVKPSHTHTLGDDVWRSLEHNFFF